jgi:hypothetical protein
MAFADTTSSLRDSLINANNVQNAAVSGPLPDVIGVSSSTVTKWQAPCSSIDSAALTLFNTVVQRQNDLATLGGNVGLGSTCYSSDTAYLTTTYGSLVSGVGATFGANLGIVGVGTTQVVAFGTIFRDTFEALRCPKLESLDVSGDNPLEGEGYVTITSSNTGIGRSTRYSTGAGAAAGIVFSLENACHVAISASITSVKNQYTTESAGMSTHVSNANVMKEYKHTAQLDYWSLNKASNNMTTGVSTNTSVVGILSSYP